MIRVWINQPSTLQEFHSLHGVRAIADYSKDRDFPTIYFTSGPLISMTVPKNVLSKYSFNNGEGNK